jgi:hypothetical protein
LLNRPVKSKRAVVAALVSAASMVATLGLGALPASASGHLPVIYSTAEYGLTALAPNTPPPGADNWSCQRSAAHPYPVVLVNGTFANEDDNWQALSPLLYNNGFCVYTFNYGGPPLLGTLYGVGDIATSAGELSSFVNQVLASTGASRVDLVGHSQGGMMPNYYIKFLGGAPVVHDFVALAPDNHGTTIDGFTNLANFIPGVSTLVDEGLGTVCESCVEQEDGSAFITTLDKSGITAPSVNYTVVSTEYDEVVTPWQSQQLSGSNVKNIVLQNQCSLDFSGHLGIAYDHIALQDVLNALDPAQAKSPVCSFIGYETGG